MTVGGYVRLFVLRWSFFVLAYSRGVQSWSSRATIPQTHLILAGRRPWRTRAGHPWSTALYKWKKMMAAVKETELKEDMNNEQ